MVLIYVCWNNGLPIHILQNLARLGFVHTDYALRVVWIYKEERASERAMSRNPWMVDCFRNCREGMRKLAYSVPSTSSSVCDMYHLVAAKSESRSGQALFINAHPTK
jgi:hypothetical protein